MIHNLSRVNSTFMVTSFHSVLRATDIKMYFPLNWTNGRMKQSEANQHVATETNCYEPKIIVIKNCRKVDNCAWWVSSWWAAIEWIGTHSSWSTFRWANNLEIAETTKTETKFYWHKYSSRSLVNLLLPPAWMKTSILFLLSRLLLLHVLFIFRFLTNTQLHHSSSDAVLAIASNDVYTKVIESAAVAAVAIKLVVVVFDDDKYFNDILSSLLRNRVWHSTIWS